MTPNEKGILYLRVAMLLQQKLLYQETLQRRHRGIPEVQWKICS